MRSRFEELAPGPSNGPYRIPDETPEGERNLSYVPAPINRQNQDLRDFMIGQGWEISVTVRFKS